MKTSIDGVVVFHRSESSDCICCEGNHIYGREIKIEPYPSIFQGLNVENVRDFISESLCTMEGIEGKKVRVTIEVVE
jgi:hypothetical protein